MKKIISVLIIIVLAFPCITAFAEVEISAKSAVLMERDSGKILYEKSPDERVPIASVTKIMTMLLIMEEIDSGKLSYDDKVTVSEYAMSFGGSTMFLEAGEVLPVHDMLKGIAVASANDGCVAMAEHISGSTEIFVKRMNERAKELGMNNTNFINTNGLDAEGHYSSARDVAIMSRELAKHEKIFEYTSIWTDSLRDGKFDLANTNKLVRFYKGANGLKTGSTDLAGCCLSATATRDGINLISVVLGAPTSKDRFSDATKLLDYGFANFRVIRPVSKDEVMGEIDVTKGMSDKAVLIAEKDFSEVLKKDDLTEIETKLSLPENIKAPISKGDVLGKAEFWSGDIKVGEVQLVAQSDIKKKSFFNILSEILKNIVGV